MWEALVKDVCIYRMSESIEWVEVFYSEMWQARI